MALIIAGARNIVGEANSVRAGGWQTTVGRELHGQVLGILGLGGIGSQIARIGAAFGMEVQAWSQHLTPEQAEHAGAVWVPKEALFAQSDALTIHLVLSDRTRGLVGAEELAAMKPTSWLINTSRGPIVDEPALIGALTSRSIAGAALDVCDTEPLPEGHPFRTLPNVLATPTSVSSPTISTAPSTTTSPPPSPRGSTTRAVPDPPTLAPMRPHSDSPARVHARSQHGSLKVTVVLTHPRTTGVGGVVGSPHRALAHPTAHRFDIDCAPGQSHSNTRANRHHRGVRGEQHARQAAPNAPAAALGSSLVDRHLDARGPLSHLPTTCGTPGAFASGPKQHMRIAIAYVTCAY